MSKIGTMFLLAAITSGCPNIEAVPISGHESAAIARSAVDTSAYLGEKTTCDELSAALREQVLVIINSSELEITLEEETLELNGENIIIRMIEGEVINNRKDITIIFDKLRESEPIPEGAFLGTIKLTCNKE
jgi:hypothetical protein